MNKMITTIYVHREKEENHEIVEQAKDLGILREDLLYLGYEIELKIEITEDKIKVLEINDVKLKNDVYI
jgi:hypothetical protein